MHTYIAIAVSPSFVQSASGFTLLDKVNAHNRKWIAALDEQCNIVGVLSYLGPEWANDKFITLGIVESKIKNHGISKLMISKLFSLNYEVRNGYYKPDGIQYLKHQIDTHNTHVTKTHNNLAPNNHIHIG
jgi:hypothetical protein